MGAAIGQTYFAWHPQPPAGPPAPLQMLNILEDFLHSFQDTTGLLGAAEEYSSGPDEGSGSEDSQQGGPPATAPDGSGGDGRRWVGSRGRRSPARWLALGSAARHRAACVDLHTRCTPGHLALPYCPMQTHANPMHPLCQHLPPSSTPAATAAVGRTTKRRAPGGGAARSSPSTASTAQPSCRQAALPRLCTLTLPFRAAAAADTDSCLLCTECRGLALQWCMA